MTGNHRTPREFLAMELKRAREKAGMKPDEVAKAVYVSEGLIRSWEKGRRVPQPDHLDAVENLFGTDAFSGILRRLREELINAALPLEWMREWRQIEEGASSLLSFETNVVPGLFQTEGYAAAVFEMCKHLGDVGEMTAARLERQQLLTRDDPPTIVVLLSETILMNNIGGPAIMRAQLDHLVRLADERENVFVHLIPFTAGVCAGFIAPFVIASFDGSEVAYADHQLKAEIVEEAENVAILRRMFERFRAHALSQPDSIAMIRKAIEERWTP
ncbi:helix-turn-helix domain-containing protein [Actinomadura sediminis]|uniref:Scr1 family TA system antitoxin-like transcriptional regulator n=1 Tax=Actinomadura sediminis TaxID=1038904 RepID=A0ABW3EN12_9ACTN